MYQSPGAGSERLKVMELWETTGRIRDRLGLQSVALGNPDSVGFMTGGAPHRRWLQNKEEEEQLETFVKKKTETHEEQGVLRVDSVLSYMETLCCPQLKVCPFFTENNQRAMAVSSGIWNLCSLTLAYQPYLDSF